MKLADYLSQNGLSTADFAAKAAVSQAAISRYATGLRVPRREVMDRIVAATDGQVTPNDFFGIPEEADAA